MEERTCTRCGKVKPITEFAIKRKSRAAGCKPCLRDWARRYRDTNSDVVNGNARQGYAVDSSKKKASKRAYRVRHADALRKRQREKYLKGYAENPQRWLAANTRRKRRLGVGMTRLDRQITVAYRESINDDACYYCGAPGEHVDHYFPVAKGGTDHWFNLVRSCGPCNRVKHAWCGTRFALKYAGQPVLV